MKKLFNVRVHFTWLLVITLVTIIVTTQFTEDYPLRQRILLGIAVSFFLLVVLIVRELLLDAVAFRKETPAPKITFYFFGGVYPENRNRVVSTPQPLLFLARYSSNLIITIIFYALFATFINTGHLVLSALFQWMAYIYFLLFLLHFLPAFPLDGGQMLRLILWKKTQNYYQATRIASLIGWAAGLFLIFAGVLVFIISQEWIISLLIVTVGWILEITAGRTLRYARTMVELQNVQAQDIMIGEYPVMPQQTKIGSLIRDQILIKGWSYIVVVDDTQFKGILTLDQINSQPAKSWNNTTIGEIMTSADQILTVHPQQTADTLFEEMYQRKIDILPVLENGNLVGIINRQVLLNVVKIRSAFGV